MVLSRLGPWATALRLVGALAILTSPIPVQAASPSVSATPAPGTSDAAGSGGATTLAVGSTWFGYQGGARRGGIAAGFPAPSNPALAWQTHLDGAVYGQPIVIGGTLVAATENDSLYGLDATTGAIRWQTHVGTPVSLASLPCGNIDPLGITGAAVYDLGTRTVFAVAEVARARHVLVAINPANGGIRWSRTVDLPGQAPPTHQQRAALVVANGYVYIGFGGLAGDCGQYRGKLVGVPVSGHGSTISYVVPARREGAVWMGAASPTVDAAGHLYIATGNGSSTTAYDGSDSVVELTAGLQLASRFTPSRWQTDNRTDADLGSMSPTLLANGFVFIAGKSGIGYVLRQGRLGGIGGQVSSATVCRGFGGAATYGNVAFVPCDDGIRKVAVDNSGRIHLVWRTTSGATGSPVVGGGAVWAVNIATGTLFALAPSTGAVLASMPLGPVPHFASPTLSGGLVYAGTMGGVTAVRPAG